MDAAASFPPGRRAGIARLVEHCAAFARVTDDTASPARARLETMLGSELAGRLVGALAPDRRR